MVLIADIGDGGPVGVSSSDMQALSVGLESMVQFQKDVQRALDDLDASTAAPHKLVDNRVELDASGNFGEAIRLWSAYVDVRSELIDLSTQLKRQIEAMQMTVQYVQGTYEGNEAEFTAKYKALQQDYANNAPAPAPPAKTP
ncbi:hypothetical protein ACWGR4_45755 [Embleya sp. NPDC055664]|uniref:hypothetical protein n=1 Tax=Embleya sp. NPDC059237 TaxID=3346784 RepID=UPI00367BF6B6